MARNTTLLECISLCALLNFAGDSSSEDTMAPTQREKHAKPPGKRSVCNSDDFMILLDFLEDQENWNKLFGSGKKTVVGGKFVKKQAQWDVAAAELKTRGFVETTGSNLYKKWQRYISNF